MYAETSDLLRLQQADDIASLNVIQRFVDFVVLGRLAQNGDDSLDRRTTGFSALKLANRDGNL